MLKNYFKIAIRRIWNNKVFSAINVVGLAIGLSASFVIGAMIYYDLTFDKFHPDGNRIYRITTEFTTDDGSFYNSGVTVPLGDKLKEGVANVELTATFFTIYTGKIENEATGKIFRNLKNVVYTDKNYFQLFPYQWLAGIPDEILSNPDEIVLTKSSAIKYFPGLSPTEVLGKSLIWNDSIPLTVSGVVNNFEKRSDLIFEEFISYKTANKFDKDSGVFDKQWNSTNSSSQVFVKVVTDESKGELQKYLDELAKEHEDKEMLAYGESRKFHLQPLKDLHFNANYGIFNSSYGQANKSVLISLGVIALFLLLLGGINFINLNTANASKRAKEIGIRKTLGSFKKQLVIQFLGETFILTITAAIVSLFFSAWLMKIFSDFMPQGLSFELFKSPVIIVLIIMLLLVVTILSGFYPALVLSHFKPISVLKNQVISGENNFSLRKYLTIFQFVIAQVFIISTILVGKQINFLMSKDMGFKTEAIAYVRTPWTDSSLDKRLQFKEAIKALPQVSSISLGGSPPASFSTHSTGANYFTKKSEIHTNLQLLYGDQDYMDLYGINLLAGRKRRNDTIGEFVINETYLKILGFESPQDAIDKMIVVDEKKHPIVGVMADFNQRSLKSRIEPMALVGDLYRSQYSRFRTIHFSLPTHNTASWPDVIAQIEETWKIIYPDADFKLKFMDEAIQKFYRQEQKTSVLLNWATGLLVLISCLGLLGLVIHTTEKRTKEIGIRKVLGASLTSLNILLCKEFLILVGLAFIISAPIAWWGVHTWLQDFAYKTSLSWWVFLLSGVLMLFIALAIMSVRTLVIANANPVKSLQTE